MRELVSLGVITSGATAAVFMLIPALGPFGSFFPDAPEVTELVMLRSPGPWTVSYAAAQGITVMPSYHTVLAILFVYAFRSTAIFPAVLLVNLAMLPSIPPIGGHYLADMPAGAVIAISGIAIGRLLELSQRRPRRQLLSRRLYPGRLLPRLLR
ncbi:MAG TPA: phosphatase PAP2 family protein [Acetobacteraceae bacterium]|nr:phosphatase PAP2 family protein [Acetobacteraceae bacterium]